MTLDEAIKHCKEKAEELRLKAEQVRDIGEVISSPKQPYNEPVKKCRDCAEEHEQLAEWLEDYKRLLGEKSYTMGYQDGLEDGLQDIREQGEWIKITKDGITPAEYTCSNCGRTVKSYYDDYFIVKEYPFCHCGAKMRGGTE